MARKSKGEDLRPPAGTAVRDAVSRNIRQYRRLKELRQDDLIARMSALGYGWARSTLSNVERGARTVAVDELCALAMCLGVPLLDLLDPAGPTNEDVELLWEDGRVTDAGRFRMWLQGRVTVEAVGEVKEGKIGTWQITQGPTGSPADTAAFAGGKEKQA